VLLELLLLLLLLLLRNIHGDDVVVAVEVANVAAALQVDHDVAVVVVAAAVFLQVHVHTHVASGWRQVLGIDGAGGAARADDMLGGGLRVLKRLDCRPFWPMVELTLVQCRPRHCDAVSAPQHPTWQFNAGNLLARRFAAAVVVEVAVVVAVVVVVAAAVVDVADVAGAGVALC